jgi:hypothetical protein
MRYLPLALACQSGNGERADMDSGHFFPGSRGASPHLDWPSGDPRACA